MTPSAPTTIDVPAFELRAAFDASTLDEAARTVEVVWTTGAKVRRYSWRDGPYDEELDLTPKSVRLQRLNTKAPLLDTHSRWTTDDVVGVIEPGTARVDGKQGRARVRFRKNEHGEEVFRGVQEGVLGQISVGYRVHEFQKTEREGEIPVWRAVDWEPYELSLVPIAADAGAGTRSAERSETNPCVIRDATMTKPKDDPTKADPTQPRAAEEGGETRGAEPQGAPTATADPPTEPSGGGERAAEPKPLTTADLERAAREAAAKERAQERGRIQAIRKECARFGIDGDFVERLIDSDKSIDQVREALIDEVAKRYDSGELGNRVTVGATSEEKLRDAASRALLHRYDPFKYKLEDADDARAFGGLSLMELGAELCKARGVKLHGDKLERAGIIIGMRGGMMGTSDFPLILANVLGKTLRDAYDESPQSFGPIVRRTTVPDFKEIQRTQLGEAPKLEKVNEHGEFHRGSMGEAAEKYQISTYGKIVSLTRQAVINDDLDAFTRIPAAMGRQVRNLESDLVWAIITANAAMGDGVVLFHANHGNVGSGVIGLAGLNAGRLAMRTQKGLDGVTHLNIMPAYLIVPAALETKANQEVSLELFPAKTTDTNPFRGAFRGVLVEPRLDATSTAEWYLAAAPGQIDTIELALLQGQTGPFTEQREGFDIDGVEFKIRHDVGAKAIDWRGLYKSSGS